MTSEHQAGDPQAIYTARLARARAEQTRLTGQSNRNGNVSLALLGASLALLGAWLWQREFWMLAASFGVLVGFIVSFLVHGRVNARLRAASERVAMAQEGLARLARDWDALPLWVPPGPPPTSPFARDLDVLGRASLQHLLGGAATPVGRETLQQWLLHPADASTVAARQEGVRELAPQIDFREELGLQARLMRHEQARFAELIAWAEAPGWLAHRRWLLVLAWLLPVATVALLVAQLMGLLPLPLWLLCLGIGYIVLSTQMAHAQAALSMLSSYQDAFATFAALFARISDTPSQSAALRQVQRELTAQGSRADRQLARLGRLVALLDIRGALLFTPVRLATLWDVHLLRLLERWQREAGPHTRGWLAALGTTEALAALATLAHDNPGWSFPDLDARAGRVTAMQLGHPLLLPERCVRNDLTLGPDGRVLLITGSNMSGKSTLLRAVGLNVTLAQMGAPVCASGLRLPPVRLATSMRVQDSLEQGVSFFLAELQRLKLVVDAARIDAEGRRLLFLLDEILQGTNTAERQIAALRIIAHLLEQGAFGAVSTHDLTLANAPELAAVSDRVYLTEQVQRGPDGPTMTFDYTLRPGIAPSTNALVLMELVGLPGELAPGPQERSGERID